MSSIGIMGGTFDPVHLGHLITAQALLEKRGLDKIIFIPAYVSPHKTDINSTEGLHRLNMLKEAVNGYKGFEVSDIELRKGSVSYTIDTLKILKKSYNGIELIIGYDNILKFDTWKEPDAVFEEARVVVLRRNVINQPGSAEAAPLPENYPAAKKYIEAAVYESTPVIDISATQIRERVKKGLDISFLVPQAVKEYIYRFNLYKEQYT